MSGRFRGLRFVLVFAIVLLLGNSVVFVINVDGGRGQRVCGLVCGVGLGVFGRKAS